MAKTIYISATRVSLYRPSRTTIWAGTLAELVKCFGYTLECGHSWNSKVNMNPKSAKSLVTALNKASEASCRFYQDCYYELATEEEIKMFNEHVTISEFNHSYTIPNAA